MKIAKVKVWKTLEGELVEDGHEKAAVLVAMPGQRVTDEAAGNSKLFDEINPKGEAVRKIEPAAPSKVAPAKKAAEESVKVVKPKKSKPKAEKPK